MSDPVTIKTIEEKIKDVLAGLEADITSLKLKAEAEIKSLIADVVSKKL